MTILGEERTLLTISHMAQAIEATLINVEYLSFF